MADKGRQASKGEIYALTTLTQFHHQLHKTVYTHEDKRWSRKTACGW
jgi:hypothetical protein